MTNTIENGHKLMPPEREQEDPRGDGWFVMRSGSKFFPLQPRLDDINIEDIAFALSNICRFGGHVEFYSVAEHSCIVSDFLPQEHKLMGLLHDGTEAFLGDMVRPLKQQMPSYQQAEQYLWGVIAEKFDLPWKMPDMIKEIDNRALLAERNALMPPSPNTRNWYWDSQGMQPLPCIINRYPPSVARYEFIKRYNQLTRA